MKCKQIIHENMSENEMLNAILARLNYVHGVFQSWGYDAPMLPIKFNMTGRTAGELQHKIDKQTGNHILIYRFNPTLARENFEDYIKNTVPHEACHYFQYLYSKKHNEPFESPHGRIWVNAMRRLGLVPDVRHVYDVKNVPSQQRPVKLQCPAHPDMNYTLTVRKGRDHVWKVKTGSKGYVCNICKTSLIILNPESLV